LNEALRRHHGGAELAIALQSGGPGLPRSRRGLEGFTKGCGSDLDDTSTNSAAAAGQSGASVSGLSSMNEGSPHLACWPVSFSAEGRPRLAGLGPASRTSAQDWGQAVSGGP